MGATGSTLTINQPHIPDFTDPLGLLVHCHERIEAQLVSLERAAEVLRAVDTKSLPQVFLAIPHILLENNFVFPVAARVLPVSEIQALGEEMRNRRRDTLQKLEKLR